MTFNLATILRESAKKAPDKILMHFADQSFSYAQVDEVSGRVASALLALGLRPGQTVAVELPNVPQFVVAYFGILKAGLVMLPLNPLLKGPEIAYHLADGDAAALITIDVFAEEALQGVAQVGELPTFVVRTVPGELPPGTRPFDELYQAPDTGEIAPTNADDTAVLLYTSGTTGRPKGAELTHFQMFMACTVAGDTFGFEPDDVMLVVLPLFHAFGLSSSLNTTIRFGATTVLIPRFDPNAVFDAIDRHRATLICGVPTMYIALTRADVGDRDVSSLRVGASGGASIPGEVIRAFEATFPGVVILEGYGLSETVAFATFNASAQERKVLSIGKPMWGVDLRIVDEADRPLPPGPDNVGEIIMRGHNVMKGYYKNPEATATAMKNGWFHTGDLAYADEDGFIFIVDRTKDLVIRGGFNVYPREIEEVLYAHEAVVEAAVIGKPDERLGEEVIAFVSIAPDARVTPEELIAYARERVAAYKYPREVHILPELPKGTTGKILKTELRPAVTRTPP
ncbi:MAG TPA: long-chain fatty acid--CoA ligase [Kineosporiaceae bacterium]|nr:long-chain fatty acid--CoA ligase [Kineosporiaceae bacterium]